MSSGAGRSAALNEVNPEWRASGHPLSLSPFCYWTKVAAVQMSQKGIRRSGVVGSRGQGLATVYLGDSVSFVTMNLRYTKVN